MACWTPCLVDQPQGGDILISLAYHWLKASFQHFDTAKIRNLGISNHLEERLLDQAQARASYTPLFWGHSHSIPQGMIFDVQPLVKSLFGPIRQSPNGFF